NGRQNMETHISFFLKNRTDSLVSITKRVKKSSVFVRFVFTVFISQDHSPPKSFLEGKTFLFLLLQFDDQNHSGVKSHEQLKIQTLFQKNVHSLKLVLLFYQWI